jgi:uncharacterized protein (DUF4415 family)
MHGTFGKNIIGKITSMTIAEAKKLYTPAQVKTMIAKAKVSKDDNPYTPEEWRAKAEYPNSGQSKKEVVKKDIHIRLNPSTLTKLKALGRGWQTKLSAKVDEWVRQGTI